jgi:hypothetical protein
LAQALKIIAEVVNLQKEWERDYSEINLVSGFLESGSLHSTSSQLVGEHSLKDVTHWLRDDHAAYTAAIMLNEQAVIMIDDWAQTLPIADLEISNGRPPSPGSGYADRWVNRTRSLRDSAVVAIDVCRVLIDAAEASKSASVARDAAQSALISAGRTAEVRLGQYFDAHAKRQESAAVRWTIGAIAATVLGPTVGLVLHSVDAFGREDEAMRVAYPLLIALAFIGLATYFARLAGHHRRQGSWSRSIQVQLESVDAFLGVINSDETRSKIHEVFANRVFGAPPERIGGRDNGMQIPIQELLTLLTKQA